MAKKHLGYALREAAKNRPRFIVTRNSEGRFPKVKFSKSPVERVTRKRALQTIFDELEAKTFRQRRTVWRRLHGSFNSYVALMERSLPTTAEYDQWRQEVHAHAGRLADLLSSVGRHDANYAMWGILGDDKPDMDVGPFEEDDFELFLERLIWIEEVTLDRFSDRRGRPPNNLLHMATLTILIALNDLYAASTGKSGRVGRRHDHHVKSEGQGKPTGPFFRLVKAALTLVADQRGDEAIFAAIKNHQRRRERGLLRRWEN